MKHHAIPIQKKKLSTQWKRYATFKSKHIDSKQQTRELNKHFEVLIIPFH